MNGNEIRRAIARWVSRLLVLGLFLSSGVAQAFNLQVVDPDGLPITGGFRYLVELDTTAMTTPGALVHDSITNVVHNSYAPVVAQGYSPGASTAVDTDVNGQPLTSNQRYFVSVLPDGPAYSNSGAIVPALGDFDYPRFNNTIRVIVNPEPIPTAQISILVFADHNPINNVADAGEEGLGGAKVFISDFGGPVSQDAFGNPLGTQYEFDVNGNPVFDVDGAPVVTVMGSGLILTMTAADAADPVKNPYGLLPGEALIKFLPPGKYGVQVIPPERDALGNPVEWVQTATIEGTKTVDAWVRADEPKLFIEGFGTGFNHVFFGYVNRNALPWALTPPAGTGTISGTLRYNHFSRPPFNQGFFAGEPVSECWIGLNDPATGQGLYAAPCNPDSSFTISNVPGDTYQLVTWDRPLDALFGFNTVSIADGQNLDLGNVLSFRWFGTLEGKVFYDVNQNGFPDASEAGIPEQNINLRYRNGAIYQAQPTDGSGEYQFAEVFPFFKWLVTEVDFARYKATGVTNVVDYGGLVEPDLGWDRPTRDKLTPQPQVGINPNTGNNLSRTETGPVLTQAMHLFLNQTNEINWGKTSYVAAENGGISGVVFYSVTRAEDDPRYGAPEPWEVGIPRVQVNLYQDADGNGVIDDIAAPVGIQLADIDNNPFGDFPGPGDIDRNGNGLFDLGDAVDFTTTDSWDDNKPTGCIRETTPVIHGQSIDPCADAYGTWNQIRPGIFDGGYAFGPDLPAGGYIVEATTPPGYTLVKEEDKNVDFGDAYTPSTQLLPPVCAGDAHLVPAELSLFPGVAGNFAGQTRPLCDRKLVTLNNGQNAAADFYFFTEVPKAALLVGFSNNDLSAEFDPSSPVFGEKSAPSWLPVAIRDWAGNELSRVYMDEFGSYTALMPSTFTMNAPAPSGVSPNMLTVVLNDPFLPNGTLDPFYDPNYSVTPWVFNYTPGHVSYLDTPLVPIAAFAGFPKGGVDGNPASGTPRIAAVDGPEPQNGPLLCTARANGSNITLTSLGQMEVTNPDYDFNVPGSTPTIPRDYGFGNTQGTVTLDGVALTIVSWTDATIVATVPGGLDSGRLLVTRGDNGQTTESGVTLNIIDCTATTVRTVASGTSIQTAIDAAVAGDLILVEPGIYDEMVILYKPVTLQGAGAGSTTINANPGATDKLVNWHAKILALLGNDPFRANEGPGIMVLGNVPLNPFGGTPALIDGFTVMGALAGGGIDVNSDVDSLTISNNRVTGNQGNYAGGIAVGAPDLTSINTNIVIRDNEIVKNGGIQGSGGIGIYTGATGYLIENNLIKGNFSRFNGGGIGQVGLSDGGMIRGNQIVLNEINNGLNIPGAGDGAGIYVGGELAGGDGAGSVTIEANLIQGNLSGSGYGGGIRTFAFNSPVDTPTNTLTIINNIIANNVAGVAAGGISLQDAANVIITHNTIVNNDSAPVGANAFIAGQLDSLPQPAGVAVVNASPVLTNNIVLHNRAFAYNHLLNAGQGGLTLSDYWDLNGTMTVANTLLTSLSGPSNGNVNYTGNGNQAFIAAPLFVREYTNDLVTAAVIDEGGNAITLKFLNLDLTAGDYHLRSLSQPLNAGADTAVNFDIDGDGRDATPDLGADELAAVAATVAMIGAYENGTWYLDANGNGQWDGTAGGDRMHIFGTSAMKPVTGDWNRDGFTEIAAYDAGIWYFDLNGNGQWDGTPVDGMITGFGTATALPVSGDWNGDGQTQIGTFENGVWMIDANGNGIWDGPGGGDLQYTFGTSAMKPVTGDWNNDGIADIGAYENGVWYLDMNNDGAWGGGDQSYTFGTFAMTPVSGDWNGDLILELGAFENGQWYLDASGSGDYGAGDLLYSFGTGAMTPVSGTW